MPAVANGISFQTATLRDTDSQAAAVCYAYFFIFPYPTATYAKRTTYSLTTFCRADGLAAFVLVFSLFWMGPSAVSVLKSLTA